MAEQFDNNLRGVLFPNDKGDNPKRPDMTGNVEIDGTKYKISAWNRQSKNGNHFLSMALQVADENTQSAQTSYAAQAPAQPMNGALDDDLPF